MSSISNIDLKYEGKISDIPDITGKSWIDTVTSDRFFLAGEGNSSSEEVTGYSDWYVINGGYNYFKSKCLFNELLMAELYKEFKVKCLEFSLARVGDTIGIISPNFRSRYSSYSTYEDFLSYHGASYLTKLSEFRDFISKFLKSKHVNELINDLSRLLAADFFSGQGERQSNNLLFEEIETQFLSPVVLAPISDNGAAFY